MMGMPTTRASAAAALVVAGLLASGCSGGPGAGESEPISTSAQASLAGFDECNALSESELRSIGVSGPGTRVDQGIGEPGCEFEGDKFVLTVYKAEDDDRGYWERRRDNFERFENNRVGSHDGAQTVTKGSGGLGMCSQMIFAGGGTVSAAVAYEAGEAPSDDETCDQATEIAKLIEPKLPK